MTLLPDWCHNGEVVWTYVGPMICFHIIEMHLPNRGLRQFNMLQIHPTFSFTDPTLLQIDLRGKYDQDCHRINVKYTTKWHLRNDLCVRGEATHEPTILGDYFPWDMSIMGSISRAGGKIWTNPKYLGYEPYWFKMKKSTQPNPIQKFRVGLASWFFFSSIHNHNTTNSTKSNLVLNTKTISTTQIQQNQIWYWTQKQFQHHKFNKIKFGIECKNNFNTINSTKSNLLLNTNNFNSTNLTNSTNTTNSINITNSTYQAEQWMRLLLLQLPQQVSNAYTVCA